MACPGPNSRGGRSTKRGGAIKNMTYDRCQCPLIQQTIKHQSIGVPIEEDLRRNIWDTTKDSSRLLRRSVGISQDWCKRCSPPINIWKKRGISMGPSFKRLPYYSGSISVTGCCHCSIRQVERTCELWYMWCVLHLHEGWMRRREQSLRKSLLKMSQLRKI